MPKRQRFICFDNRGYEASLERREIYTSVANAASAKRGLLRIVDKSGEDYLYPEAMFRCQGTTHRVADI